MSRKKQTPAQIAEALGKYIAKQEETLKRYPVGPMANSARQNLAKGQAALEALKGKSEMMRKRMQSQLKGQQAPMQMELGSPTSEALEASATAPKKYDPTTDTIRTNMIAHMDAVHAQNPRDFGTGDDFAALYDVHIKNGASPQMALAMTSVAYKESGGDPSRTENGAYRYSSAKGKFSALEGMSEEEYNKMFYELDANGKPDLSKKLPRDEFEKNFFNKVYGTGAKMKELGNETEEDGYKYRGRGQFQLTGKNNYRAFGEWAHKKGLVDSPDYFVNNPDKVATLEYADELGEYWFYGNDKFKDRMGVDIGKENPTDADIAHVLDQTYARVKGATGSSADNVESAVYSTGMPKMRNEFYAPIITASGGTAPDYTLYDQYYNENLHEEYTKKDGSKGVRLKDFSKEEMDVMAREVLGLEPDATLTERQRKKAQKELGLTGGAVDGAFGNNFLSAYAHQQAQLAAEAAARPEQPEIARIEPRPASPVELREEVPQPDFYGQRVEALDMLPTSQIPTDQRDMTLQGDPVQMQQELDRMNLEAQERLLAEAMERKRQEDYLQESRDLARADVVAQPDATRVALPGLPGQTPIELIPEPTDFGITPDEQAQIRQTLTEKIPLRGQTLPTVTITPRPPDMPTLPMRPTTEVPNDALVQGMLQRTIQEPPGLAEYRLNAQEQANALGKQRMLTSMYNSGDYSRRDIKRIEKDPDLLQQMFFKFLDQSGQVPLPNTQPVMPELMYRHGGYPKMTGGGDVGEALGNVELTPEQRGGVIDPTTGAISYPNGSYMPEARRVQQLKESGDWEQPKPEEFDYSTVGRNDFIDQREGFNRYFDLSSFSNDELLYDTIGRPFVHRDTRTGELVHFTKGMYSEYLARNRRMQDVVDDAFGRSGTMIQTGNKNMPDSKHPTVQATGQYWHDLNNYELSTSPDADVPAVQAPTTTADPAAPEDITPPNRAANQPLARGALPEDRDDMAPRQGNSRVGETFYNIHGQPVGVYKGAGTLQEIDPLTGQPTGTARQLFVSRNEGQEGRNAAPVYYNQDGQIIGRYLGGGNFGMTPSNRELMAAQTLERIKLGNTEGDRRGRGARSADASTNPYMEGTPSDDPLSDGRGAGGAQGQVEGETTEADATAEENNQTDLTTLPTGTPTGVPGGGVNIGKMSPVMAIPSLASLASIPIQRRALDAMEAPQAPVMAQVPQFNYRSSISQQLQDARSGVNALSRNTNLNSATQAANRQGLLAERFRQENRLYNQDAAEYQRQRNAYDMRNLQAELYNTQLRNKYQEDLRNFNNTRTLLDAQIKQQPLNVLSASASDYLKNIYGPNQQLYLAGLGRNFDPGLLNQEEGT